MNNYLAYWFYWVQVHSIKLVYRLVLSIVPLSIVQGQVTKILQGWGIKVSNGKSDPNIDKKKYSCEMVVHDSRFYKRFAVDKMLAHGECYMEGWFDSSDLSEQIRCIITKANMKAYSSMNGLMEKFLLSTNQQSRSKSLSVAEIHYNLGNDFFQKMLDPTMAYTCGYWKGIKDDNDLEQAQINKLDLIARKLKLKPGMKVLDLGCGWGSAAKFMAQNYKVSVVGYNIAEEQVAYARNSCKGLDCEFRLEDYRNAKQTGEKYDAVFSIGFFEHVGMCNFREYFEVVEHCLKDDGLHLVHCIVLKEDSVIPRTDEWLNKYIFPGGELPFPQDFFLYSDGLFLVEDLHNFGYYYTKTLKAWRKRFIENWPQLKANYEHKMGGKFYRMWLCYLEGSIAGFECRGVNLYQVVQSKKGVPGGYESVR